MLNFGAWPLRTLPIPDGSISEADRAHLLGLYSGITPTAPGRALNALSILTRGWDRTPMGEGTGYDVSIEVSGSHTDVDFQVTGTGRDVEFQVTPSHPES